MSLEELCSSVKEPEEADHAAKCHLLQDGSTTEQTASVARDDWLNILGHDRLKKRVSFVIVCMLLSSSGTHIGLGLLMPV